MLKWLRMKSVSLDNVAEMEDVECPPSATTPGVELVGFASLGRQNGFCVHGDSEEDDQVREEEEKKKMDTDVLVTCV